MAKKPVRKAAKKAQKKAIKKTIRKAVKKAPKKIAKKAVKKAVKKAALRKKVVAKKAKVVKVVKKKAATKAPPKKKAPAKKSTALPAKKSNKRSTRPRIVVEVRIIGIKPGSTDLILVPEIPEVHVGDYITWTIDCVDLINEILDIYQTDTKRPPLFPRKPSPLPTRNSVTAHITGTYRIPEEREYAISYTLFDHPLVPVTVVSDPKIQVNP
jgi:hypothetical protein